MFRLPFTTHSNTASHSRQPEPGPAPRLEPAGASGSGTGPQSHGGLYHRKRPGFNFNLPGLHKAKNAPPTQAVGSGESADTLLDRLQVVLDPERLHEEDEEIGLLNKHLAQLDQCRMNPTKEEAKRHAGAFAQACLPLLGREGKPEENERKLGKKAVDYLMSTRIFTTGFGEKLLIEVTEKHSARRAREQTQLLDEFFPALQTMGDETARQVSIERFIDALPRLEAGGHKSTRVQEQALERLDDVLLEALPPHARAQALVHLVEVVKDLKAQGQNGALKLLERHALEFKKSWGALDDDTRKLVHDCLHSVDVQRKEFTGADPRRFSKLFNAAPLGSGKQTDMRMGDRLPKILRKSAPPPAPGFDHGVDSEQERQLQQLVQVCWRDAKEMGVTGLPRFPGRLLNVLRKNDRTDRMVEFLRTTLEWSEYKSAYAPIKREVLRKVFDVLYALEDSDSALRKNFFNRTAPTGANGEHLLTYWKLVRTNRIERDVEGAGGWDNLLHTLHQQYIEEKFSEARTIFVKGNPELFSADVEDHAEMRSFANVLLEVAYGKKFGIEHPRRSVTMAYAVEALRPKALGRVEQYLEKNLSKGEDFVSYIGEQTVLKNNHLFMGEAEARMEMLKPLFNKAEDEEERAEGETESDLRLRKAYYLAGEAVQRCKPDLLRQKVEEYMERNPGTMRFSFEPPPERLQWLEAAASAASQAA